MMLRSSLITPEHRRRSTRARVVGVSGLLYNCTVSSRPLQVSEARKRLSALVERVARGGTPVAIGRYGRERAVLVGAEQYAQLARAARRRTQPVRSIEGTMTLNCAPEELIAESRRLGELWLATLDEKPPRIRKRRRGRRPA
jgi:prevent-host-death family protein